MHRIIKSFKLRLIRPCIHNIHKDSPYRTLFHSIQFSNDLVSKSTCFSKTIIKRNSFQGRNHWTSAFKTEQQKKTKFFPTAIPIRQISFQRTKWYEKRRSKMKLDTKFLTQNSTKTFPKQLLLIFPCVWVKAEV